MTKSEITSKIFKLKKELEHDRDYELDDPGGYLTRSNNEKEIEILQLENQLLKLQLNEALTTYKYRVWESHCGDASTIYEIFEAKNDEEAKKKLKEIKRDKHNRFSTFWMERIDQEEKTTTII